MDAALRRPDSLPTGVLVSIGIHVLVAVYIVVSFSNPQPLEPPVDLSKAIPISMEMFRPKPPPPPPEPPKVKPKPQTPKEVVRTTAPEAEVEVSEPPEEPTPPAEPEQPTMSSQQAQASYASLVAGIIQRNKRYPRDALQDGDEGVVEAFFVVNHQGHVIAYRIEKSSGVSSLDQEIVRLLKRIAFPPIPDDGGDPQRREFRLPITFKIAQ
ncbi:MAG TPA: energy transducer TonB [Candidatus Binatia bacterium]|nr:energy transducer TonB [Candidatus Binatia bacterium]